MQQLKAKDEAALAALMELYGDELLRTAYLLTRDLQTAEEAVQDTFIQAYHKIGQLRDPGRLRSWLLRIAVNRCRMRMRSWSWRSLFPHAEVEALASAEEAGPEEELLLELRSEQLTGALHRLDYKYREVITLYYYNEWSVAEIAEELRTNANTIKARLSRGRARLKEIWLQAEGGEAYGDGAGAGQRGSKKEAE